VLHVVDRMDCGGVETLVMRVYRRLDRSRLQFDFAVAQQGCDYDAEILAGGGRLHRLPRPSLGNLVQYSVALATILRRHGPFAAVHSHVHYCSGAVLLAARTAGVPVRIAHSHTTNDGRGASPPRRAYRGLMRRWILANATQLLACSGAAGQALYGDRFRADPRFQVVPNGLEPADYEDRLAEQDSLRRELNLPRGVRLVGHVGRLAPPKNHRFLLEVFAALAEKLPDAHFLLVGEGPLRSEIESQISRMALRQRVSLLGFRSDIPRIMRSLDAFVFPSVFEGLPNTVVEAQASGVPCVVSDSVSPEADLGLGLTSYLSLGATHETWAEAVVRAMDVTHPPWPLRQEAIENNGYAIGHTTALLQRIYQSRAA
jgi:glycosyltransferase EpsF